MEGYENVLIFGEMDGEHVSAMTAQIMRIGKKLAEDLKQELHVIFVDEQHRATAAEAHGYGADKVYMAADALLAHYMTDSYLQVLEQAANELKPAIILFGQNQTGLDVAPRLAFRLKTGVTLDCVNLTIDGGTGMLEQVKPVFGGKAQCHFLSQIAGPQIATVREGAFDPAEYESSKTGEIVEFAATLDASRIRTRFIRKEKDASQDLALKLAGASIVVSGGRGLKNDAGVDLIKETAELLNGAVAGTRPAIDLGWMPNSLQVGLTGKKVNPQVYLAVGISGALQHMAGCLKSKTIVAINTDESAPIFRLSHFGVVGDFQGVLKGFNEEFKKVKQL
jgi:electron transfer flavoprotein alpha subunit